MENQLVIEIAANRIAEHIAYNGVADDAIKTACDVICESAGTSSVGIILEQAKTLTVDAVATCTKLSKMLRAETITKSDLTGSISELAYTVFVGHVQDVACEMCQNKAES